MGRGAHRNKNGIRGWTVVGDQRRGRSWQEVEGMSKRGDGDGPKATLLEGKYSLALEALGDGVGAVGALLER